MRAWSLVVLALCFFTLCLKPVKAAGNGTLEVIMPKRVTLSVVHHGSHVGVLLMHIRVVLCCRLGW